MPYEDTKVDAMRSWGDICAVLYAHGCEGTAYTELQGQGFQIEFVRKIQGKKVLVRMPVAYDLGPEKDRYGHLKPLTPAQIEQEKRTKWRSLFYYIKAQFDAIDKGIVAYEQAFLADIVGHLPDGRTGRVIDVMPGLAKGRLSEIKLLPEGEEDDRGEVLVNYPTETVR
jgi:hypothetical protein